MTSHPNDMGQDLIDAHAHQPALMPFLHLPVQSGSDRILRDMNRKHTARDYLNLIKRVRRARPDIALSSDFIVGFPGETEEDFQGTLDLIAAVNFSSSYFFKYSMRPGTPGAEMEEQVPEEIKSERLRRLQDLVDGQRHAYNDASIGKVVPILFEKKGRDPGQIAGKSPYLQAVQVQGPDLLIGRVADVLITEALTNSLRGTLVGEQS
jgi:tRNA-2-methylthio-N6-dimethylallyladenosine synthase